VPLEKGVKAVHQNLTGKTETVKGVYKEVEIEFRRDGRVCLKDLSQAIGEDLSEWLAGIGREVVEGFDRETISHEQALAVDNGRIFAVAEVATIYLSQRSRNYGLILWVSRQLNSLKNYGEILVHHTEWSEEARRKGCEYNRQDRMGLHC
jgi:hypothetical protein